MEPSRKPEADKQPRILLLDDESEIVDLCARALRDNYLVVRSSSPFEAVSFMDCGRKKIDLVVCDYNMPGMNGCEFVEKIREMGIFTPVLLYTGMIINRDESRFRKFAGVLAKPFNTQALRDEVASALRGKEEPAMGIQNLSWVSTPIQMAMQNLESVLEQKGLYGLSAHDPESAMKVLGPGKGYSVFLSWLYLNELYKKLEE